jgi:hypothetical protein
VRISLFQPHYPYGKPQIYLPTSLMNLGSRLMNAGHKVSFADLNFTSLKEQRIITELTIAETVGITILGPPYIPEVSRTIGQLRGMGYDGPILIGGEGAARLQRADFKAWFGENNGVWQVKNDADLTEAIGMQVGTKLIPSAFETSMVPMLKRLPTGQLARYLVQEFAIFMSNGCIFNCNFCSAAKGQPEQYRSIESLEDEVEFIAWSLGFLGHPFTAYLTNLDLFQNADQLEERVAVIARACEKHRITPRLRGLATSRCAFNACREDSGLPYRLRRCGLHKVGFGADGASEETWRRENKRHNSLSEFEEVVRMMKCAGISPELLMVLGFQGSRPREIFADLKLSFRHALRGTVIRPYLAKSKTPSTGRWFEGDPEVEQFRTNASLLDRLDYAMLGSKETHPNRRERWLANAAYLTLIGTLAPFGLCPTRPLVPVPVRGFGRTVAQTINRFMPFDQ